MTDTSTVRAESPVKADLFTCDAEPIHVPGAIQRFGFLLAMDPEGRIFRVSANLPEFLPLTPAQALGQPVEAVLGTAAGRWCREFLRAREHPGDSRSVPVFDAERPGSPGQHTMTLTASPQGLIIEGEPKLHDPADYMNTLRQISKSCEQLRQLESSMALLEAAARIIAEQCGYHRTMVYRFDSNMNGDIIVEVVNGVEPRWLDHHFPHSDIPAQARALYLRNRIRMIADIDYTPSPLLGLEAEVLEPLDLSDVMLRSVSPVHVEYLQNMGVRATITMSLVLEGRLWGLIVCHHNEPRCANWPMRLFCDLIAQFVSLQLEHLLAEEHRQTRNRLDRQVHRFLERLGETDSIRGAIAQSGHLLQDWEADGFQLVLDGERIVQGREPPEALMRALLMACSGPDSGRARAIERIGPVVESAGVDPDWVAGALLLPLSPSGEDYLVWLRREQIQSFKWGGQPDKQVAAATADKAARLSPRGSFETWIEEVRGRCLSWTAAQIESAEYLARLIRNHQEQKVAERNKQLLAANAAKSEFLANMSHEIRTPMNAVLGLAQLLEKEPLAPDQRDMVQRIRRAGRSLLGILNDILDFSKIEAGQIKIEPRPFNLLALLDHVTGMMTEMVREKGLELRREVPAGMDGGLLGDALRLEQILLNLLGNAGKFTEQGEILVRVIAQTLTATTAQLRFEVRDTGVGIPPEVLPTLFQPFTQADGSITRRFGGTGLGLSICKRLVELMEGVIGVESQEGVGSVFWFELPFGRTVAAAPAPGPGAPAVAPGGPRLAGRRVLVVDDSDINRALVARALKREGAEAVLAHDGQQALDALRATPHQFDAVLMDVQMPVLDGLSATRALRSELGLTDLPVIALTASVLDEDRQQALAAGVNDFLGKPVDLEEMTARLQRWISPPPR